MIVYKCDRCGRVFDWYGCFYADKKFNHMTLRELDKWEKEHPDERYDYSPRHLYSWNCIHLQNVAPINDNMSTNDGVLSAEIEEGEGNNDLLMFCQDCMTDFVHSLVRKLEV